MAVKQCVSELAAHAAACQVLYACSFSFGLTWHAPTYVTGLAAWLVCNTAAGLHFHTFKIPVCLLCFCIAADSGGFSGWGTLG